MLLVEDNLVNQKIAAAMLKKLGCSVDLAENGSEAVEMLDRESYDVVFMDCQMPEMDGYQATMEIRRREGPRRQTPIVALTAHAMKRDRERCLEAGMDDYLAKPARSEDLGIMLARWCGNVRRSALAESTEI